MALVSSDQAVLGVFVFMLELARWTPNGAYKDVSSETNDDSSGEEEAPKVLKPAEYFNTAVAGRRRRWSCTGRQSGSQNSGAMAESLSCPACTLELPPRSMPSSAGCPKRTTEPQAFTAP